MDLWTFVLAFLIFIVLLLAGLKIYFDAGKGVCHSNADLTGKTVLITGANAGIGYYTALDIARRNARVILACRSQEKGLVAMKQIQESTGNKNIVVREVDLSLMASVKKFAEKILREEAHLDILINNAGVAGIPKMMTAEGFETVYATNHFGPFLLTNLLLDLLKKSAPSRIVNVSSIGHKFGSIEFDNLKAEKWYSKMYFYGNTKLANILFTRELARRLEGTGVSCYVLHPGAVGTDLFRDMPFYMRIPTMYFNYYICKTPEQGAQTSIYCAVSEEVEGKSGKYYMDCRESDELSPKAQDDAVAKKLWEISEFYLNEGGFLH
ncbi:hypothetical protein ACJMK2_006571 [Sinanodonta woodiana]|uniref:Retinol dehydrogenase 11 n=1 Tax=Sinanodonta woodiana TaxID=1069815 RepID=A0ABD3VTN1_SINWO